MDLSKVNVKPNYDDRSEDTYTGRRTTTEETLQSFCKSLIKSRIFRGFYLERRFVNPLNSYRDIISLQRSERELEKLLLDIKRYLEPCYRNRPTWVGVTNGPLVDVNLPTGTLETFLWVELDELAFGQYWFSIKNLRFRDNEVILKLKVVREVEDESSFMTPMKTRKRAPPALAAPLATSHSATSTTALPLQPQSSTQISALAAAEPQIEWQDFVEIVQNWGIAIKQNVYTFMAQDINKENIKSLLRLVGLLLLSVASGAVVGIKFLGIFTLRFMFEFSRLTHVLTPIIMKIIDVLNKIVGGFYILIAMVWRDTFGKKLAQPPDARMNFREVDYNRPLYRAIQYDVRQQNQKKFE